MNLDALYTYVLNSIALLQPEVIVTIGLLGVLIIDLFTPKSMHKWSAGVFLGVMVLALISLSGQSGVQASVFFGMIAVDGYAVFFKYLFLVSAILATLITLFSDEMDRNGRRFGDYFIVMSGLVLGMMLMAGANNLLMMFISIELVSLASYILVSYLKDEKTSNEAGVKYIIYGAFSSGLMIYGISLIYGITGTLSISEINEVLKNPAVVIDPVTLTIAVLLTLGGFGYKIAAAPFHFWAPDAYEGAPTPVAAFLSVGPKAAGFAMMLRFFKTIFFGTSTPEGYQILDNIDWVSILAAVSVLTMTIGNVTALWQQNVKRMLAYSSIAHAGYILMGVILLSDSGIAAMMFYLAYYLIMNLGVFFTAMLIADKVQSFELDDWRGMGFRAPVLAVPMVIFLASLIGIPGTVGFAGKFLLFVAVLQQGSLYFWLALIAVANSVVSAFYYFKVVKMMYLKKPVENADGPISVSIPATVLVFVFAVPTIVLGLWWQPLYNWALASVRMLVG